MIGYVEVDIRAVDLAAAHSASLGMTGGEDVAIAGGIEFPGNQPVVCIDLVLKLCVGEAGIAGTEVAVVVAVAAAVVVEALTKMTKCLFRQTWRPSLVRTGREAGRLRD